MDKNLFEEAAELLRKKVQEFDEAKVRCAIIGNSGSGKSSLINSIVGKRVAPTDVNEKTIDPGEYFHGGLALVDLPGCGTPRRPQATYVRDMNLLSYDVFLIITAERFTENDLFLYRELTRAGKQCFVIRNKLDRAIEDARHDNDMSEDEVRSSIVANIRENLAPNPPDQVYLTSARQPQNFDLPQLLEDILATLSGVKKDRFAADMAALNKKALEEKKRVAEEVVKLHAALAAANGFNPILGPDIAADIAILMNMGKKISHIYGFEKDQMDFIKALLDPKAWAVLTGKVAQFTLRYLAADGVVMLLRQFAKRATVKQTSKWIPFVGFLIAAGIGWKTTYAFGEQLLDDAHQLAEEILNKMIEGRLIDGC
jgi:predicted GTPase